MTAFYLLVALLLLTVGVVTGSGLGTAGGACAGALAWLWDREGR